MKKQKTNDFHTVGFSSILVVFVMLALATFTVLTLVSANADYKLTKAVADRNTAYIAAEDNATSLIEELDTNLYQIYEQNNHTVLPSSVLQILPSEVVGVETKGGCMISFEKEIKDNFVLSVELYIPTHPTQQLYEITSWKIINKENHNEADNNTHLHLWKE